VKDFVIPMIFYNPNLVKAQKVSKLASQIDFAPTVLGMMNFSYQSRFFGQDLLRSQAGRALMGTYQKIAYMTPGLMTVLAPGHVIETQTLDPSGKVTSSHSVKARDAGQLDERTQETVAIYQAASELFFSGRDKLEQKFPTDTNTRSF
jgi:phosphoglycerol transferase MdoB-like AlkP superfamily enzyme